MAVEIDVRLLELEGGSERRGMREELGWKGGKVRGVRA